MRGWESPDISSRVPAGRWARQFDPFPRTTAVSLRAFFPFTEPPITIDRQPVPCLRLSRWPPHGKPAGILGRTKSEHDTAVARGKIAAAAFDSAHKFLSAHVKL